MPDTFGNVLKQARRVRGLSAVAVARAASISAAYLNRLENDAVTNPSPHVLHRLSEALAIPYIELLSLNGYPVPNELEHTTGATSTIGSALFAGLTDDERDELLEYLAWYRARTRSRLAAGQTT